MTDGVKNFNKETDVKVFDIAELIVQVGSFKIIKTHILGFFTQLSSLIPGPSPESGLMFQIIIIAGRRESFPKRV